MVAACGSITQITQRYQNTGVSCFINDAGCKSEVFDRLFGLGHATADFGAFVAEANSHHTAAQKWSDAGDVIGTGEGVLSATRTIFPLERLVTGKMFFDDEGNRQSALSIAIDTHVLAARSLGLVNWLGGRGAYKLGAHSSRMTAATMGLWISCLTLCIADNVLSYRKSKDDGEKLELVADSVCSVVDIAAMPFDFGYVKGPAALRITGLVLRMLSSVLYLAKEAAFHE